MPFHRRPLNATTFYIDRDNNVQIWIFNTHMCQCPIECTEGISNHYRYEYRVENLDNKRLLGYYSSSSAEDYDWKTRIKNDDNL